MLRAVFHDWPAGHAGTQDHPFHTGTWAGQTHSRPFHTPPGGHVTHCLPSHLDVCAGQTHCCPFQAWPPWHALHCCPSHQGREGGHTQRWPFHTPPGGQLRQQLQLASQCCPWAHCCGGGGAVHCCPPQCVSPGWEHTHCRPFHTAFTGQARQQEQFCIQFWPCGHVVCASPSPSPACACTAPHGTQVLSLPHTSPGPHSTHTRHTMSQY